MQGREEIDWAWFTPARVRVLRGLADQRTEREIAVELLVEYTTVRSTVQDLKDRLSLGDVREIGRWWRAHRKVWLAWLAEQGGVEEQYGG
jgi:hypothetical protein